MDAYSVTEIDAGAARNLVPSLASVLVDCVDAGASVSFMAPFGDDAAAAFFNDVADAVAAGETALFVARLDGEIVGTVQLGLAMPPNQPHRADVKKLLVHRRARRRGIGAALMTALEEGARVRGKTLLVLDTATGGDADRLYPRLGWQRTGVIPDYALWPDGRLCSTTVYWKRLAGTR